VVDIKGTVSENSKGLIFLYDLTIVVRIPLGICRARNTNSAGLFITVSNKK